MPTLGIDLIRSPRTSVFPNRFSISKRCRIQRQPTTIPSADAIVNRSALFFSATSRARSHQTPNTCAFDHFSSRALKYKRLLSLLQPALTGIFVASLRRSRQQQPCSTAKRTAHSWLARMHVTPHRVESILLMRITHPTTST